MAGHSLHNTVRGTKVHGLQFKAEGQETLTVKIFLSWAAPPYTCVCVCGCGCGCVTYAADSVLACICRQTAYSILYIEYNKLLLTISEPGYRTVDGMGLFPEHLLLMMNLRTRDSEACQPEPRY